MTESNLPPHKLYESVNARTVHLTEPDWYITASTNPISSIPQCAQMQSSLDLPAIPEMTFGGNFLLLEHRPSGWKYAFTCADALKGVKKDEDANGKGMIKVNYADAWMKSRYVVYARRMPDDNETRSTDPNSSLPMPKTVQTRPCDWTFTTTYKGHRLSPNDEWPNAPSYADDGAESDAEDEGPSTSQSSVPSASKEFKWQPADPTNSSHAIPLTELIRPDPIVFYAEVPLFEDELHDNGASSLLVRIRVMPACVFLLARFTLRVDNVLFRTYDTRMYSSYSPGPNGKTVVVRESSGWEAEYSKVKQLLPDPNDLTLLTNPTWIAQVLAEKLPGSQRRGAGTGWDGMGKKAEVLEL
ncbi:TIP41-like family-domain-containing protein [Schizophyllum amplum]|uniref:TIP41-like family-domain-containing protein n=1 Tax=Schizophyllum amplum TaxID=97359 RepID=A0A550CSZ9_9AGAR|nr:TIP41-like family-domain-containing protein [Auriculariopsis ampla]